MIPKKEKIVWTVYAIVLAMLFLVSSTDIIIKEEAVEVYPISVIVDDSTDDFYVNFRKGVDQAASDYHADVSFITLYESSHADQQMNMVTRELEDGARAVILSPVADKTIIQALDDNIINDPLVVINSELSHNKISYSLSMDYYKAGKTLAEQIAVNTPVTTTVYLLTEGLQNSANARAYEGLVEVLTEKGYQIRLYEGGMEGNYREVFGSMVYPNHIKAVLVAVDTESLSRIAQILDERAVYRQYVEGLYGIGSTLSVLNYLDEGIISGIVVSNDFIQGYLSIQKAVEAIRNTGLHDAMRIDHFYMEKEDIRRKEFQKLLYPVD